MKRVFFIFVSFFLGLPLYPQKGEIIIEENKKIEKSVEEIKEEKNIDTKKDIQIQTFKRDTKEWKIKIYIGSILFFISLIYVVKSIKRRRLYK